MKNKKLIITIVVCLLLIAITVGGLYLYTKKTTADPAKPVVNPNGSTVAPVVIPVFPLKQGSKGTEVKKLQAKMNEWMNYNYFTVVTKPANKELAVDGVFGPKTLEFVKIIFALDTVSQDAYNNLLAQNYTSTPTDTTPGSEWYNYFLNLI